MTKLRVKAEAELAARVVMRVKTRGRVKVRLQDIVGECGLVDWVVDE